MVSIPRSGGSVGNHPIAKTIGGPKRPVTGRRNGSAVRGEHAELVAFRVGKHHPCLLALADVDVPRP